MSKMHKDRFTLQFDPNNSIHFNAISILNDKARNKSNYIADLIWEKEFSKEQEKNDLLKQFIKESLLEILEENQLMFGPLIKNENNDSNEGSNNKEEIVLNKNKSTKEISGGFNKEVMQGLSAFGIKQK